MGLLVEVRRGQLMLCITGSKKITSLLISRYFVITATTPKEPVLCVRTKGFTPHLYEFFAKII